MNITGASPQRRRLGIERFISGEESLEFDGVVFRIVPGSALVVASYSEFAHLEQVTREEAARKIERSKQVLEQLSAESPEFGAAISGLDRKFEFCFDYGTGAAKLATLEGGVIKWFR